MSTGSQQAASHLKVDVVFSDPVYFAGEELECKITFRNIMPFELQRTNSGARLRKASTQSISSDVSSDLSSISQPQSTQQQHQQHQYQQANSHVLVVQSHVPGQSPHGNPVNGTNGSSISSNTGIISSNTNGSPMSPSARPGFQSTQRRSSMKVPKSRGGETLMMGYVQLSGSFVLDESLVNTEIFEEAKKQGIVGGNMGGGVVGLAASGKPDPGYLWSLGFGLSNGISQLINGTEVSSIAEMKSMASSNAITIISTPQSLLFVDLRLNPGESKSYSYKMILPKALPPSYRGRALRISYHLSIGTQRIDKGFQQPKVTKFPFRVFQNIDPGGNQPVHSLTSPIIILRDEAIIRPLGELSEKSAPRQKTTEIECSAALQDFTHYVDRLLSHRNGTVATPRQFSDSSLPDTPPEFPSSSSTPEFSTSPVFPSSSKPPPPHRPLKSSFRESIDFAIQRNSFSADGAALNSVFEIARNKQKICTLMLSKPVYKLGETVILVFDFAHSILPCYHLTASLETTEIISSEVAQRTPSFNERATRKVYVQSSLTTISSKRTSFSFCIPTTATPQFDTSYISSRWSIRLQFVTVPIKQPQIPPSPVSRRTSESHVHPRSLSISGFTPPENIALPSSPPLSPQSVAKPSRSSMSIEFQKPEILSCSGKDDRVAVFSAVEYLSAETFECRIPIKVFPTNQDIAAMSFSLHPMGGYAI
ncbi:Rgp1-domain-containing protein [Dipodascopsis uninucleata]